MYRYRIGKKCVKELQQNLFTAHGVKTVEHFCSIKLARRDWFSYSHSTPWP